jgi:hypothetical protein
MNRAFEYQTSLCLVLKWFWYSDHHYKSWIFVTSLKKNQLYLTSFSVRATTNFVGDLIGLLLGHLWLQKNRKRVRSRREK